MTVNRCYRSVKLTSQLPPLYNHREGTPRDDSCVLAIFHIRFILSSNRKQCIYSLWSTTLSTGFPNCIIFYCYLRIFKTLRSHNNFLLSGNPTNVLNVEVKVARTVFVTVAFLICVGQLSKDGSLLLRFPWHKRFWPLYAT